MADRSSELRDILATVRVRWSRRAFLRAWMLGAVTAGAMLMVGLLAVWLLAQDGIPLVLVVTTVGLVAGVSLSFAFLPLRVQPTDRQIARFIEEQAGGLDEVVVTAVDTSPASTPVGELLVADAIRAARSVDPARIVTTESMRSASICSVTAIEPICAAIAEPQRAATMMPASTGPISRVSVSATVAPTNSVAPNRLRKLTRYNDITAPEKNPVSATIGTEATPMNAICVTVSPTSNGR